MGDANFLGGLLGGLGSSLQKQQEFTQKQEYQKSLIEINKLHGKLFEAQARAAELKSQGLPQSVIDALNATEKDAQNVASLATQGPSPMQPQQAPVTQTPQSPMWGPGSLPKQMAQGQMNNPLQPTGGQAPPLGGGMVQMSPAGQMSTRNKNVQNIRPSQRGWEKQFGGEPGEGNFLRFPTPEHSLAAATWLWQDYARQGKTVGQAIETWAPLSENPNTPQRIAATARALGVSPDTPLVNVPLAPFIMSQVKYESPTEVNPAFWGEAGQLPIGQTIGQPAAQTQQITSPSPMQPPGQQLITPNFPKPTGIGKLKLGDRLGLDVFFKQTYDLDTKFRETKGKFKLHGTPETGYQIINEDSGQIVTLPPTQQKLSRYSFTTQTGAEGIGFAPDTLRTPVGGGAGGAGEGGPVIQTKPPEFTWQSVKSPTGAESKIAVPKAQPGAIYQEQPPGAKIGDAGRFNMVMQADNRIKEVNKMLITNGKINRSLILKASAPSGGIGEGSQLYSKMYQVVDSALRLETGAQANETEIKVKMQEFWPSWKDTDATIKEKLKDLNEYANGAVKLSDPTGEIRKMRQPDKLSPGNTRGMQIDPLGIR